MTVDLHPIVVTLAILAVAWFAAVCTTPPAPPEGGDEW